MHIRATSAQLIVFGPRTAFDVAVSMETCKNAVFLIKCDIGLRRLYDISVFLFVDDGESVCCRRMFEEGAPLSCVE